MGPSAMRTSSLSAAGSTARSECGATPTLTSAESSGWSAATLFAMSPTVEESGADAAGAALRRSPTSCTGGQKRDRDAGFTRRREVPVERAGRIVHVMEFSNGGVAVQQHLDIEVRGDRFGVRRRHALDEAVHELAPGPEIVRRRSARLGEAGHRALEGVRMQVRHARQHRPGEALAVARRPSLRRCRPCARR